MAFKITQTWPRGKKGQRTNASVKGKSSLAHNVCLPCILRTEPGVMATPTVLVLGEGRPEDQEFKASLDDLKPSLKRTSKL